MRTRAALLFTTALAALGFATVGSSAAGVAGHTWTVTAGVEAPVGQAKHGIQANDYLPREIWIDAGDTVVWRLPTGEPHTITFLAKGQRRPLFNPANPLVSGRVGGTSYSGSGYRNSGVCETRLVGPSGAVARLGGLRVVRDSSGVRLRLCAFGMNRPGVHGDAGLAPAVGLIRSLSALTA